MTKVLIIEDEPLAARRLTHLLNDSPFDLTILDTIDSVSGAVSWLTSQTADLIFLDIHLADGISFSIFDQVDVTAKIIFTTAYDQYAIRAFKVNSVDYLLKPIEGEELQAALEKYEKQVSAAPVQLDTQALLAALTPGQGLFQKRFMVSSGDKIKSIKIEDVAYFFGQKKYVFLITKDNRRHIINYTLGKLEEVLDPSQFFRINRQFIISFDSILQMHPYSKSRIKIDLEPTPDMEAIVSIDKARFFKNWLNR